MTVTNTTRRDEARAERQHRPERRHRPDRPDRPDCPDRSDCSEEPSRRPPHWLTAGQGALRFPTAPLRALIAEAGDRSGSGPFEVALRVGISRRRLRRVMRHDSISWQLADALAVALGRHPSQVWPQWFAADLPEMRLRPD